jgi:hypothetical protein
MEHRRKPQFLSAVLGPNLFVELSEELYALGEGNRVPVTCLPDVGAEAEKYGLSADDTVLLVRGLAHDLYQPATVQDTRIEERWADCIAGLMRGYYCSSEHRIIA